MYMQSHSHCFNACLKGRFFNIMESKEYLKRSDTDDDARIDWGIIFCVLVLAVIGMTALYVALSHDNIVNPTKVLLVRLSGILSESAPSGLLCSLMPNSCGR